jgi:hypothetical protein
VSLFADVISSDWGSLGGLRPSQRKGPGLISGETRPLDRLRPCRSAPAGAFWPPPALAGAIFMRTVGSGSVGQAARHRPAPPSAGPAIGRPRPGRTAAAAAPAPARSRPDHGAGRESELAPASYRYTV